MINGIIKNQTTKRNLSKKDINDKTIKKRTKANTTPHFLSQNNKGNNKYVFEIFDQKDDDCIKEELQVNNNNNSDLSLIPGFTNVNNPELSSTLIKEFFKDEDSVIGKHSNNENNNNQKELNSNKKSSVPLTKNSSNVTSKSIKNLWPNDAKNNKEKKKKKSKTKQKQIHLQIDQKEIITKLLLEANNENKDQHMIINEIQPQSKHQVKSKSKSNSNERVRSKNQINYKNKLKRYQTSVKSSNFSKDKIKELIYKDILFSITKSNSTKTKKKNIILKNSASMLTFSSKHYMFNSNNINHSNVNNTNNNNNLFTFKDNISVCKKPSKVNSNGLYYNTTKNNFKDSNDKGVNKEDKYSKSADEWSKQYNEIINKNKEMNKKTKVYANSNKRKTISNRKFIKKVSRYHCFLQTNLTSRSDKLLRSYFMWK